MQRSLNVDNIEIIANRNYKGTDFLDATVLMEYVLPSKKVFSMYLDNYGLYEDNFVKYTIPANTMLTAEGGDIEVTFTFVKVDTDSNGEPKAYVRKTGEGIIRITPISAWLDFVPDERLGAIDQRLLAIEVAQKNMNALNQEIFEQMVQDIAIDDEHKKLKAVSKSGLIGEGVELSKLSEIIGTSIIGQDPDGVNDGVTYLDKIAGIEVVKLDTLVN